MPRKASLKKLGNKATAAKNGSNVALFRDKIRELRSHVASMKKDLKVKVNEAVANTKQKLEDARSESYAKGLAYAIKIFEKASEEKAKQITAIEQKLHKQIAALLGKKIKSTESGLKRKGTKLKKSKKAASPKVEGAAKPKKVIKGKRGRPAKNTETIQAQKATD